MKQKKCYGRTPETIKTVRPLKDGVIADFTATKLMLKNIMAKVCQRYNCGRPRVVVGVPSGITEVEERAVEESILAAGAKEVYLIEEPMAAAIGANLDIAEPTGNIIVDIGGGTTEVAVISLGGVVVGVPSGITEVEERAVEESVLAAGAKEVYLIEEPMAAAIGANLDVAEPTGNIIVDIGGGTTEVAVISLGGVVVSNSLRIAGDELDEDIVDYIKKELGLAIGETTAEEIKVELGCALPLMTEKSMEVRGRDLNTGLPRNVIITSSQMEEAMRGSINEIIEIIKATLEKTPPELASDIVEKGIVLARRRSIN